MNELQETQPKPEAGGAAPCSATVRLTKQDRKDLMILSDACEYMFQTACIAAVVSKSARHRAIRFKRWVVLTARIAQSPNT